MPYASTLTADVTNKKPGDPIRSADWNALVTEVIHLSENKLDRTDNALQGDLNVPGSLAVDGATTLHQGVTVAGPARLQAELSVGANSEIGGSLRVQREVTVGEAVRAPVFISTSRMIHRMYPASPLIYEDIFVALDRGVIAKLGNPRLEDDWNVRHTAAKPYRGRPLLQLGSSNDSDGNGAVVTVPEGYNTLWLRRVVGGGGSAGLKAYFLDGAGEALGHWSGAQRPYQVCPDGSLPDNAGAKEGYEHQWLAIPVGRSGKVALISQQSDGYVWYSGVAFSRNPWAHAAQSARGCALGFNGSRGVTWHSAQSFGDQAGSIAPSQAGSYSFSAQWGSPGSGSGQFLNPFGMAVDSSDNVYVADQSNHRVQKFDSNGRYLTQWGSRGSGSGQFLNPFCVAVDSSGNVYVVDEANHCVQKFDSGGRYLTRWGSGGGGSGQFLNPYGVAVDRSGNVYISDRDNHCVQKFAQGNLLQVPVIPNGRDKLLYLVNAPQLKDEASYDNGLQFTALRVNGQPVERFLATYDNPFAHFWNSRPGCNYNAALVPAERIPADARFLSVEIDLSRQFDDIKFREVGTHDLDVPLAE